MASCLPIQSVFQIDKRRFYLGPTGRKTLRLIREIEQLAMHDVAGLWAVRSRTKLHAIRRLDRASVVTLALERCEDDWRALVVLWIRGHLHGRLGSREVARFLQSPHPETRKAAIRALRRMGQYSMLDEVALSDPNPRLRRIATARSARPFPERLEKIRGCIKSIAVPSLEQPLQLNVEIDPMQRYEPKSVALIRAILMRIQRLVGRRA